MYVWLKKITEDAVIPTRATEESAGLDLCGTNTEEIIIPSHSTELIGTGIAIRLPRGYCALVLPRSGIASKRGLRPANSPGLIDSDYTGEIKVALHNDSDSPQKIQPGERIAQLLIIDYPYSIEWIIQDELPGTERGAGGFGSSDSQSPTETEDLGEVPVIIE